MTVKDTHASKHVRLVKIKTVAERLFDGKVCVRGGRTDINVPPYSTVNSPCFLLDEDEFVAVEQGAAEGGLAVPGEELPGRGPFGGRGRAL